jgi:sulfate permease, SulP family
MTTRSHPLLPKLISVWREGYGLAAFRKDLLAGLTVAIVALPLAMAIAIASGARPDQGLITAIVAGFIISAAGGSRYQIGGPTAAFIVVVLNVIVTHGYDGMLLATFMAGLLLIVAGLFRLGTYIKYVPYPVITGFTAGIALTIFLGQLEELFGLKLTERPHDVLERLMAYTTHLNTISPQTLLIGGGSLALMLFIRRFRARWPVFLIGVGTGAAIMALAHTTGTPLDVATVGSRFPSLPHGIPMPSLPDFSLDKMREVLPSAFTIAFLAGVEALLSAVVADGMTGRKHRPNAELIAQGAANCASVMVGGLPATGAIARTATNIRSGAHGPVAGMFHAIFVLIFFMFAMDLAGWVPLASLAAVLIIVAWNISEIDHFKHLMRAPAGDRLVLLATFFLTVFADLTIAIMVGVVLASFLFMHRMAGLVAIRTHGHDGDDEQDKPLPDRSTLPEGVEIYQINGPFFFGAASEITGMLDELHKPPRFLILLMSGVPFMDASGVEALRRVADKTLRHGGQIILTDVHGQPGHVLKDMGIRPGAHGFLFADTMAQALQLASH